MAKLKVFCATSGFYDHVVAAPSRPAALRAWGARTDLFSMGVARLVSDPKIEKEALKHPGEVIRLKRSGDDAPAPKKKSARRSEPPSRARLQAAERAQAALEQMQAKDLKAIQRELETLEKKRDQVAERYAKALASAEEKVAQARDQYRSALDGWQS